MKHSPPKPRDDDDRRVLRDIAESGCHIAGVLADEEGPAFAYSIGLFHNFEHPEIIIFGLNHELMQSLINSMCDDIRKRMQFLPNQRYPDIIADFDCEFRTFDRSRYYDFVGYARWFYDGDDFPVVQCFWPDKQALFPWEPGCHPTLARAQSLDGFSA